MTQLEFHEVLLPADLTWTAMLLLPTGQGDYMGIGLLEAIWKMIATIINARLMESISLYDYLHVLRQERRMVTATLEANLAKHMAGIFHNPCFRFYSM